MSEEHSGASQAYLFKRYVRGCAGAFRAGQSCNVAPAASTRGTAAKPIRYSSDSHYTTSHLAQIVGLRKIAGIIWFMIVGTP